MRESSGRVAGTLIEGLEGAAHRLGIAASDPARVLAHRFGIGGYVTRHRSAQWRYADEHLARRFYERMLLDAAAEISGALDRAGVTHCFVRGIVLVPSLYHPGDRDLADIDLLVTPDAEAAALEVLKTLDYHPLPSEEQGAPATLRSSVSLMRAAARYAYGTTAVDLHWGLRPVDRLLPRPRAGVPAPVWRELTRAGGLPAPAPAHHAALIVHHLVLHDLLHVRALLDLAQLRDHGWSDGTAYEDVATRLGVRQAARALHTLLVDAFGFEPLPGVRHLRHGWRARRLRRALGLESWFAWAGVASQEELARITPRRVGRRILLLERMTDARRVVADAVAPPAEHLRWRWPAAGSYGAAWLRHLRETVRKVLTE